MKLARLRDRSCDGAQMALRQINGLSDPRVGAIRQAIAAG